MIKCTSKNNQTVDFRHDASKLPITTTVLSHASVHWEFSIVYDIFKHKTTAMEVVVADTLGTATLVAVIVIKRRAPAETAERG